MSILRTVRIVEKAVWAAARSRGRTSPGLFRLNSGRPIVSEGTSRPVPSPGRTTSVSPPTARRYRFSPPSLEVDDSERFRLAEGRGRIAAWLYLRMFVLSLGTALGDPDDRVCRLATHAIDRPVILRGRICGGVGSAPRARPEPAGL